MSVLIYQFMPVGQLPRWIVVEQRLEQLKDVIHSCMEHDYCVPAEVGNEYNKLIEEKRNFDKEEEQLREGAKQEASFKQRVLDLINFRLKVCEDEHAHPTVRNQYAFMYNRISQMKD